jgi:uncharacterized phage infection (PIP) family protein YhgE
MEENKMAEEKTTEEKTEQQTTEEAPKESPAPGFTRTQVPGEKPVEKDLGEELAGKDINKFTPSEMVEYIDKLKDENAKRRIANRTLKDAQTKAEKKLTEIEKNLETASKKLQEVESEKKASADAEKSEVERLKGQLEEFQKKLGDMEGKVKESDQLIFQKDLLIKKQSRETEVNTLLQAASVKFSSDYERQGFMTNLLKTDAEGDFVMNDEAVHYEVGQFIKKAKETKPPVPETPPAGPPTRTGEPGLNERIKALTAKAAHGGLTSDDQTELNELLELAGQAAAWDPRQAGG